MVKGDCEKVGQALKLLGAAYRSDWMDFDGRTLRSQLDELAGYLSGESSGFDKEGWAVGVGICPVNGGWSENCSEKPPGGGYDCVHVIHYYDNKAKDNING